MEIWVTYKIIAESSTQSTNETKWIKNIEDMTTDEIAEAIRLLKRNRFPS